MRHYEHGGDIYGNPQAVLDFSVNLNPLGMPEEAYNALLSRADEFKRYPDPHCRELRIAIARHEGVPEEQILCGNGAADLIYRLCYAVRPLKALVCAPTFSEYELALEQCGCQVTHHELAEENGFALTGSLENCLVPGIDILFLCHPNNPTGLLIPQDLMERILRRARKNNILVAVDECFLEFTKGTSAKKYLNEMRGLVILKAFTKLYSMAGLRLGYILASDETLIGKTDSASQCWSVSVPAQIAGTAALAHKNWAEKTRRLIAEERHFLSSELSGLGVNVFKSDANFFLIKHDKPLYDSLLKKGVMIRKCENFKGLDSSYYRIGIKTRNENIRLLEAVKEALEGKTGHWLCRIPSRS